MVEGLTPEEAAKQERARNLVRESLLGTEKFTSIPDANLQQRILNALVPTGELIIDKYTGHAYSMPIGVLRLKRVSANSLVTLEEQATLSLGKLHTFDARATNLLVDALFNNMCKMIAYKVDTFHDLISKRNHDSRKGSALAPYTSRHIGVVDATKRHRGV